MPERVHMEHELRILLREFEKPQDAAKPKTAQQHLDGLRPFFRAAFSRPLKAGGKTLISYGPRVGEAVTIEALPTAKFDKELDAEGKRLAAGIGPRVLKFAPDIAQAQLTAFYRTLGQALPRRLSTIDENTTLTRDEDAALLSFARATTIKAAKDDAQNTAGFYSATAKKIVMREADVDAGSVAHEMAHAYADEGWRDFIFLMQVRRMKETATLDEGLTTRIAERAVKAWAAKQPGKPSPPSAGYGKDHTDKADQFIKELGTKGTDQLAFVAFFGGFVDFTDNDRPEDFLVIGDPKRATRKWKWPWR